MDDLTLVTPQGEPLTTDTQQEPTDLELLGDRRAELFREKVARLCDLFLDDAEAANDRDTRWVNVATVDKLIDIAAKSDKLFRPD